MHRVWKAGVVVLAAGLCAQLSAQVTVTLDRGTRYQTIEGFGATPNMKAWDVFTPFAQPVNLDSIPYFDSLVSEFGATMWRVYFDGRIEETPGETDHPEAFSQIYDNVRRLADAARRQNEPIRFIASSWSPPAWMKVGESLGCGSKDGPPCHETTCRLKDGMEPHVADYFVRYVRLLKDSAGIDLYALGVQNEPAFQAAFPMCKMCPTVYRDVLKATGARFRQEGLGTRFFGCEHMAHSFGVYEGAIRPDEEAMEYMHAWAVHGYGDGVSADTAIYQQSVPTDKPFWQTEISGKRFGWSMRDWPGAMVLGNNILAWVRDARASVWTYFDVYGESESNVLNLTVKDQPTYKYYACSHLFRYIRPGAQQIGSSSSDSKVRVVATYHDENDCLTIVLINARGATNVTLSGDNLPATFEKITSTAHVKLQRSTVASNETISLPDTSIVTLVAGAYRGTGPVDDTQVGQQRMLLRVNGAAEASSAMRVEILRLDGRRVGVFESPAAGAAAFKRLPAGGYVRAVVDARGRVVSSSRLMLVDGR